MHAPLVTLVRVIETLHRDHPCEIILIAPKRPNPSRYARLIELLVDFPLVLSLRKDIFTSPTTTRDIRRYKQCAYTLGLSSDPSKQRDFLGPLPSKSREGETNPLELTMTVSGGSSLGGVVNDRWIHSWFLFKN